MANITPFLLLGALAACGRGSRPPAAAPAEERFGQLSFPAPPGFTRVDDTTEEIPSPIPGQPPHREDFRSFTGPAGEGLYFFHWDGHPSRDRGPMAVETSWDAEVAGQQAKVSQTTMFFGVEQRVLVAHFGGPDGHRYLVYMKSADPKVAPERDRFMAILASIRLGSQ